MPQRQDLDHIFREWPYESGVISARLIRTANGRDVIQMRIEMGLLQMEVSGRPDGQRPSGSETFLDHLREEVLEAGPDFVLSEEQCFEMDREFLQYYQRRICFLALQEFERAVADADHTLALMDLVAAHSPDEDWTNSHEQYRPFVLFHRTQAAALATLKHSGAEAAIEEVRRGLDRIREVYLAGEAQEEFEQDELVNQLVELLESLRREYQVGKTLAEQLSDAVAAEEYERAARLRDEIAQRRRTQRRQGSNQ